LHEQFLYASSSTILYRWRYTPGQRTNLGTPQVVITNIPCCHHVTRTPIFDADGLLYISSGSASNVDPDSTHSCIHSFNISNTNLPLNWNSGTLFADGLRNEIGLAFDIKGQLWGVENGCDNLNRADLGGDIHQDNPSEEVNHFTQPGKFYGYPYCWSEEKLALGGGVGTQWLHPQFSGDGVHTDAWCKSTTNNVPPAWNMGAHQAPMDIVFYNGNSFPPSYLGGAFVSLHGSWNRNPAQGYRVNFLAFQNGVPVSETPLLRYDGTAHNWPSGVRPVGLAFAPCKDHDGDMRECLLVTSDATGQIIKIGFTPPH